MAHKYKFTYDIGLYYEPKTFFELCDKISFIEGVKDEMLLLEDVDGTLIKVFSLSGEKIIAICDNDLGVYVESDVELNIFFDFERR